MIIKEKGNTKCFFYSDDKCRDGDRTRDCINCVRVTYHSLYSLNFDNQERLQKKIKHKEQECKKLKKELTSFMNGDYCANGCSLRQQLDQLKVENEILKEKLVISSNSDKKTLKIIQTLAEIKELCKRQDLNQGSRCIQILQKISEVENAR